MGESERASFRAWLAANPAWVLKLAKLMNKRPDLIGKSDKTKAWFHDLANLLVPFYLKLRQGRA